MAKSRSRKPKSARNPGGRSRARKPGRRRWLVLPLALGVGAAALYLLLTGRSGEPLDHIGDASRQRLERVMREADRADESRR